MSSSPTGGGALGAGVHLHLLSLPVKHTDQLDFTPAFLKHIEENMAQDPRSFTTEMATLNKYRQDMTGALDVTGRNILVRYYGQLEKLDTRFPIHEAGVKVVFTWCVRGVRVGWWPAPGDVATARAIELTASFRASPSWILTPTRSHHPQAQRLPPRSHGRVPALGGL
jgi:hypothetical protein